MSSTPARPSASSIAPQSRMSSGPSPDPYAAATASSSSSSSSYTHRLAAETFSSSLPLAISLNLADLPRGSDVALAADFVYYTTVRRNLYLPLILQEVKTALVGMICDTRGAAAIQYEDLWFECKGVPLKWHWPIGLLYDHVVNNLSPTRHTLGNLSPSTSSRKWRDVSPSRSPTLLPPPPSVPWHITLRLKDLPHAKLPNPTSNPTLAASSSPVDRLIESSKQAYMGMLKEADFVRNGNTKKVNNLRRPEQDGIWDALVTGDYGQFVSLTSKILPVPSAYPAQAQPSAPPSSFPHASFRTASHSSTTSDSPADSTASAVPRRASSLYAAPIGALPGTSHHNSSNPSLPIFDRESTSEDTGAAATVESSPSASASTSASTANEVGSRAVKGQGVPGIKAIPVRFILQGGTILQEGVPPLTEDGKPTTLQQTLHSLFPALFPSWSQASAPAAAPPKTDPPVSSPPPHHLSENSRLSSTYGVDFSPLSLNSSFTSPKSSSTSLVAAPSTTKTFSSAADGHVKGSPSSLSAASGPGLAFGTALAVPILQGIRLPLSSPIAQLARSVSGADSW